MGFLKRHKGTVSLALVAVVLLVLYFGTGGDNEQATFESVAVTQSDLSHVVSVTGRVEPKAKVSLAFEVGGRIERLQAIEGERVTAGETLAVLDAALAQARREEAYADLVRERAVLTELLAGARGEEVDVALASQTKAGVEVTRAKLDLEAELTEAYTLSLDEIRQHADQLFDNPTTGPDFGVELQSGNTRYFIRASAEEERQLNRQRASLNEVFVEWQAMLTDPSAMPLEERVMTVQSYLEQIRVFLQNLGNIVNSYAPDSTIDQTLYDNFKADISGAQAATVSIEQGVRAAHELYEVTVAGLRVAESEVTRAQAAARTEEVLVQEAQVARASATLAAANAELNRLYLISPTDGIVTDVPVDAGEVVASGALIAEVMSDEVYELTVNIPEADIAQVRVGNSAELTLDAFDRSRIFTATVIEIAPAETILDGVPTYKTTLVFDEPSADIRSGMTAEIDILTNTVTDVVAVPGRSILRDGVRQYVRVVAGDDIVERDVVTGLRGSNGNVEIIEGLSAGEEVVLFLED